MLTGRRPSGEPRGNYFRVSPCPQHQEELFADLLVFLADFHALTTGSDSFRNFTKGLHDEASRVEHIAVIRIVGPREPREPGLTKHPGFVDTTSRSRGWQRGLSPFFLGPVPLYEGAVAPHAHNVENAWQFSKVYADHVGVDGMPTDAYFDWAREGWLHRRAVRYPRGKGAVPEYSWWGERPLDYVAARKRIYVRCYGGAVLHTEAFKRLATLHRELGDVVLWDYDGYDHHRLGMSLKDVLNDPTRKMGHAFVLAMLLEAQA